MSVYVPPFAVVCLLPGPVVAALDVWRLEQPGMPSREEAAVQAIAHWLLSQDLGLRSSDDENGPRPGTPRG